MFLTQRVMGIWNEEALNAGTITIFKSHLASYLYRKDFEGDRGNASSDNLFGIDELG